MKNTSRLFRQKGVTLVELMIAMLIGLMSMHAIYKVYEGTERVKRNVASVGNAQISGLYSTFLLEQHIHDAGSGIMFNGEALATCVPGDAGGGGANTTNVALSLRPLPVIIDPNTAHPDSGNFDDIYIFSGSTASHLAPITVVGDGPQTTVAASSGFAAGDVLVDMLVPPRRTAGTPPPIPPLPATTACQAYLVDDTPGRGVVTCDGAVVTPETPLAGTSASCTVTLDLLGAETPAIDNQLVNLGTPTRRHFYVDADNTLQMKEWVLNTGGTWDLDRVEPVITGVVSFRAQYGIGSITNDLNLSDNYVIGPVDQWVFADADSGWDMATVQALPWNDAPGQAAIRQIKAVRLSIIVRADEPDHQFTQPTSLTQFAECPTGMTCPDSPAPTFPAGWRYRMYETEIPLKNAIWN
ncbi:MAG: PilW family protein [Burkholderiales bacterium]|nr:PilW family protein [Burkholderiales bacterium]